MTDQPPTLPTDQELNERKARLIKRMNLSNNPAEFAADWLALATDYGLIGSKANEAGCNLIHRRLIGDNSQTPKPARTIPAGAGLSLPTPGKVQVNKRKDVD